MGVKAPDDIHDRVDDIVKRSGGRIKKSDIILAGIELVLEKLEKEKQLVITIDMPAKKTSGAPKRGKTKRLSRAAKLFGNARNAN